MATKKTPATQSRALINYDEQMAAELAALSNKIAAPSGDKVTFRNGQVVLPDGSTGTHLECILLDFNTLNMYYDRPYNKDDITPAACFAVGENPKEMVPSANSPDKQCDACALCPMNQFGSALTGNGKACRNSRQVALTPITSLDLEPGESMPVYILSVPPTSLKVFDAYARELAVKYKTLPMGVVTELYQDPDIDFVAPRFNAKRPLTAEEKAQVFPNRVAAKERLNVEPDVSGYEPPRARGAAAKSTKGRAR